MKTRGFMVASVVVFGLAALAHAVRLSQGWVLQLGPHAMPPAASWIGLVLAAALCLWGIACLRR